VGSRPRTAPSSWRSSHRDGTEVAAHSGGVQGLSFNVYVYDDHSVLSVTRKDYLPLAGQDHRLGVLRLGVGRNDLAGLAPAVAVRLVAVSIVNATSHATTMLSGPSAPGAPAGATGAGVQLRLDLPD